MRLSASAVKSWFQYRCERQFIYMTMSDTDRKAVPVERRSFISPWAHEGNRYENQVVEALGGSRSIMRPASGRDDLGPSASLAFLQRKVDHEFAYQLVLHPTEALYRKLGIGRDDHQLLQGKLDLVETVTDHENRTNFKIIDIKASQVATIFHRAQVAWYALMLEAVLEQNGLSPEVKVHGSAEIWHRRPSGRATGGEFPWTVSSFNVRAYRELIIDWARTDLPRMARVRVGRGRDESLCHVYYKCEQCDYMDHCMKGISEDIPARARDISAVPGLTQQSKRLLRRHRLRTVGDLAEAGGVVHQDHLADWVLSTRGPLIVQRAQALAWDEVRRLSDRVCIRMPPRTDVAVFLVADRDPIEGRLATLGAMIVEDGVCSAPLVHTIASHEQEAEALQGVLGQLTALLARIHAANSGGAGKVLHFFVYEPAESSDVANALGAHLNEAVVQERLLDLVRIFPPPDAAPEPEYRGYHHLPACALRTVLEETYALPVQVSVDLARVSRALERSLYPLDSPYIPMEQFSSPFSSRLPIAVCRHIVRGDIDLAPIRADVEARLRAMASLVRWLEKRNGEFDAADRFLRLNKGPFRLIQATDPLQSQGLELLRVQALLDSRASMLERMSVLASPVAQRAERQRCIAGLQLVGEGANRRGRWMLFVCPGSSVGSDIKAGDPALIISDGHPDRVLDLTMWDALKIELVPPRANDEPDRLLVTMTEERYSGAAFRDLESRLGVHDWVIDRVHFDVNTDRLVRFLGHVAGGGR